MAQDFPSNPSDGQTYAGFVYNSTLGVWDASVSTADVDTARLIPYLFRKFDGGSSSGLAEITLDGGNASSSFGDLDLVTGGGASG